MIVFLWGCVAAFFGFMLGIEVGKGLAGRSMRSRLAAWLAQGEELRDEIAVPYPRLAAVPLAGAPEDNNIPFTPQIDPSDTSSAERARIEQRAYEWLADEARRAGVAHRPEVLRRSVQQMLDDVDY